MNRAAETGRGTLTPRNLPSGRLAVQTVRLVSLLSPTAFFLPLRSLSSILIMGLTRFTLSVGSGGFGSQFQLSGTRQSVSHNPRSPSASPTGKADF